DINRTEALTMPHADGTPQTPLERASLYLPAIGSQGQIPDTPSAANGFHANPQALKRGEVNSSHRNLEFHQFSGMAQFTHFPKAFAGNCHQNITVELIPPFIHRSDNPALYPFSRSKTNNDLLLMLKGKANKVALATTPDVCLAYDLQGTRGLPGALGAWGSDPKFGTLSEINSSLIGALTLNGATPNNCMRSSGAVWDLTNRIRGNKPFQANFYTRFLRADKLTNLYSDNGFHSFHRWDGAGSRYPSRLQVVNSSFGTHGPKMVTESRYKDVWTDPSNYSNARFGGGNIDYARYVVWVGMNCCPKKYKVIWGPTPQIDGDEEFTGDAA
ncbi:MAG: hypothetical protein KDD70_05260, partial [Bdellovibrionales bacterium]|nr:hypothetical protein [Bdellovibrionales bacterium]